MKHKKVASFFLSLACLSQISADDTSCTSEHTLNRASIRHIESKGLGYSDGYTTLEGFFVPLSALNTRWVPFIDVRGHVFNDGKPAANGGLGLRYIDSRVWGGNVYYDFRKTSHHTYNQISFGLESLGRYLDYRVNGYFPLGSDKGSLGSPSFDSFSGNSIYITRKQELALKGANAELGVHIAKVKGIDFYSALGPYYFGHDTKHTFGGEFRLGMDVRSILRIEGNTSYDHLFGWIGQGQISLSYAFTPKTISRKPKKRSCSSNTFVRDRAFQRVDKQEIVVVTTQKKKSVAINPATGLPYVVWFVDNTSHSQGTYESPFNTLADAESASSSNDIIAILPGDGTDRGMNNGITLKANQKLWGMGTKHALATSVGDIQIKPVASGLPVISNSGVDGDVITANQGGEISGLRIEQVQFKWSGVYASNSIGSYLIENNIISTALQGNGVYLEGTSSGTAGRIVNNTFIATDSTHTLGVSLQELSGSFVIANNLFAGINENSVFGGSTISAGGLLDYSIVSNTINLHAGDSDRVVGMLLDQRFSLLDAAGFVADNKVNMSFDYDNVPRVLGIFCSIGDSSATFRNNQVISNFSTVSPDVQPYSFTGPSSSSISQINFAPDNVGEATYLGF